jgi:hypothetical protein
MTKLIRVGFYRELCRDVDDAPFATASMVDSIHDVPQEYEAKIVAYLRSGFCLGAGACYVEDVLDPLDRTALNEHLYTDGTYLWRLDIAHYVKKYHLRLHESFVEHMKSRNWQPPRKHFILEDLDWE